MALTKSNIIVGAARVFLGPAGTDKPAVSGTTPYVTTLLADSDWTEVGYTQDGLEVANDPSYGEIEVDQLLDSAKIFKDGMSISASTTFAEATLENLLIAWGQADDTRSSVPGGFEIDVQSGELGEAPLERGLIAVGNATEIGNNKYGERIYHLFRVLSVESTSISNSREDAATIPVTFRALPADNGLYGTIRDRLNV